MHTPTIFAVTEVHIFTQAMQLVSISYALRILYFLCITLVSLIMMDRAPAILYRSEASILHPLQCSSCISNGP